MKELGWKVNATGHTATEDQERSRGGEGECNARSLLAVHFEVDVSCEGPRRHLVVNLSSSSMDLIDNMDMRIDTDGCIQQVRAIVVTPSEPYSTLASQQVDFGQTCSDVAQDHGLIDHELL